MPILISNNILQQFRQKVDETANNITTYGNGMIKDAHNTGFLEGLVMGEQFLEEILLKEANNEPHN